MPNQERQHWPITQRDWPPIPFGRDDATEAFLGDDRRIDSQVRVTPRNKVLALPLQHAMCTQSPRLKTDNDISRTNFIRSRSFDRKQVADPQSGKHTVASNYSSHLPRCFESIKEKLSPRLLAHCQSHCIPARPLVFNIHRQSWSTRLFGDTNRVPPLSLIFVVCELETCLSQLVFQFVASEGVEVAQAEMIAHINCSSSRAHKMLGKSSKSINEPVYSRVRRPRPE
jgi:hypothetical protein